MIRQEQRGKNDEIFPYTASRRDKAPIKKFQYESEGQPLIKKIKYRRDCASTKNGESS